MRYKYNIKGSLALALMAMMPFCLKSNSIADLKQQLAEATEDSTRANLAQEIGTASFGESQDSVFKYFEIAEKYISKSTTIKDDIELFRDYGYFYTHFLNKYEEAKKHYSKALKIAEFSEEKTKEAYIYNDLGIVGWKQGNYHTAIENYYKAKAIASKTEDPNLEMRVCLSLGIVHNESALNNEAVKFYARGLELAEQLDNEKAIGMFLNNLGKLNRDLEEYDLSIKYFERADSLFNTQENKHWLCYSRYNLGSTYLEAGQFEKAKDHFYAARALNGGSNNIFQELMIDCEIAKIHETSGDFLKAIKLAKAALQKLEDLDTDLFYIKLYPILANSYEKIGKPALAVEYFRKSNEASTKSNTTQKQNELIKRNALIKYQQKALEVEQLQIEVERENLRIQKMIGYLIASILVIFFLLALGRVLFYKLKLNQLQKYEQMRTKLTYDLHDNVGSSLNQIKMLASRLRPGKDQQKKQEEVVKIKKLSDDLIGNMQDLIWSIDPEKETLENLIDHMRDHASNVFSSIDLPYRMKVTGEFKDIELEPEVKNNLYSLFKEAVNNITKHTKPELILIKVDVSDKKLHLYIENGKEIVVESKFSSKKGLSGMQARAKELGGVLKLENLPNKFIVDLEVSL